MGKTMKNLLVWNYLANWDQTLMKLSFGWPPFQNYIRWTRGPSKMATISGHSFNIGPYRKNNEKSSHLKLLGQFWPNFDGMFLWCSPFRIMYSLILRLFNDGLPSDTFNHYTFDTINQKTKLYVSLPTSPPYAMDAGIYLVKNYKHKYKCAQIKNLCIYPRKLFPVPTAKAHPGKNRDKPFVGKNALETCVL